LLICKRFNLSDSFPALFLGTILDLAEETVFAVPVSVASGTGVKMIAALRCPRVLPLWSVLESVVPPVLEGSDFVFVILGLRVAILIDSCLRSGCLCS
jgi:hypothetical protein